MILLFLLCLMNQNTDGFLHHWLKINNTHVLIKNAENFFQLSVRVNENSPQEVSGSTEENKPSVFIDNEDNLLEIVDKDKWNNETSRQLKNNEPSNSSHIINENGHDNDDIRFNITNEEMNNALSKINFTSTDILDNKIKCNSSFGICEELPYYPSDFLEKELVANPAFRYLEVNETREIPIKISNRIGGLDILPLCYSQKQFLRPKAALTEFDEMLFVVNNHNFVQLIEVEICENKKRTCDFSESFPAGYMAICQQKYIYRKLLAIDSSKKIGPQIFKIPAGCCCGAQFRDGF